MKKQALKKQTDWMKAYAPLLLYAAFMLLFCIFYLRLFIKTDDGHFLGIVSAPGFTYSGWLAERYQTVSGRTVGEFLLAFFLRHSLFFWKVINALLITYISCFFYKLSRCFSGKAEDKSEDKKRQIFCCCALFIMMVSCLNPSAFWYSGTFSYLWPFAGMLLTIAPLVFSLSGETIRPWRLLLSFFAAFPGTMQEQAAACTTALYVILLLALLRQKRGFRFPMLLPLISIAVCDYALFSAPGMSGRTAMETQNEFVRYAGFHTGGKLLCGFSVFLSNSLYLSSFLFLLFTALLSLAVYQSSRSGASARKWLTAFNIFCIVSLTVLNYGSYFFHRRLPHMTFRNAFVNRDYDFSFWLLFLVGTVIAALSVFLIFVLCRRNAEIGLPVGLCFAAGLCSALAMGFSPTVFASGQRVGFYTNLFTFAACVILFSSAKNSKLLRGLYNAAVVYSLASFAVDCFAFKLFELPILG